MKKVYNKGGKATSIRVSQIPSDNIPNLCNPYDKLSPSERHAKIISVCRKILERTLPQKDILGKEKTFLDTQESHNIVPAKQ